MSNNPKLGGASLIIGSVLSIAGNVLHPRDLDTESIGTTTGLIIDQLGVWYVSHAMLLLSFVFFLIGFLVLLRRTAARGDHIFALPAQVCFGLWAFLSSLAIIMDGFVAAHLAQSSLSISVATKIPAEAQPLLAALYDYHHLLLLHLLAYALVLFTASLAMTGFSLLRTRLYNRWLAGAGIIIGLAGLFAYFSGFFGPFWVTSPYFSPYAIIFTLWIVAIGISLFRDRSQATAEQL